MTGKFARQNAYLRLVSGNVTGYGSDYRYSLLANQEMVIGRDPSCQIVLDAMKFRVVSRRHAVIRPLGSSPDGRSWSLCDLGSANGTYLNGQRLQGCQELHPGDRLTLGYDGPEFVFEYDNVGYAATVVGNNPGTPLPPASTYHDPSSSHDSISFTQLFPIVSTGKDLTSKAYLVPGVVTVIFVVLMFATVGDPSTNKLIIATYIASAAYFFIYRLCGKQKPWWVLVGSAAATILILLSPLLNLFIHIFREVLPGRIPQENEFITFTGLLVRMFFGAGLMEELLKALPVMGAFLIAKTLPSPWRERVGVWEPLDGILLGAASALGFTLLETLGQYVPDIIHTVSQQSGEAAGDLVGLQLLIPRILGSVAGHMAYSGYFGYFIGLAVLKPSYSLQILLVGYLTSSGLHALWNATGVINNLLLVVVGVLSYAFLMAAILKARALSPTRAQNFATRFIGRK